MAPKRSPNKYAPLDWKNAQDPQPGKQNPASAPSKSWAAAASTSLQKSDTIAVPVAQPGNTKPSGGTYASAAAINANKRDKIIVSGVSRPSSLSTEGTWTATARAAAKKQASIELAAKTKSAIDKQASSGHRAITILKKGGAATSSDSSAHPALHCNFKDTDTVKQPTASGDSSRPSGASSGIKKQVQILKRSDLPPVDETQTLPVPMAPTSTTANKAHNASITNSDSVYGSNKPYDESWTAEDSYSMPPSSPTGRPDCLDSDSDTPIFNLDSRLRTSVAEGNKKPDPPSGLPEHLADQDVVRSKPRVYLGSRLEGEAGFSSGGQPDRAKGKGKLYETTQVPDQNDGHMDAHLTERPDTGRRPHCLETIGYLFGFPNGESETRPERKEEIMHAVDEAIQRLRSTLNQDSARLQKLDRIHHEATKQRSKRLASLIEELKRILKNGQQLLSDNTHLTEDKRAVVQASIDTMSLSEAEITWRAEVMEQWQKMMEMDVALKKAKLVPPQIEYLTDRLNMWVRDKPRGSRKFDMDSYTKNRSSLLHSLRANDIENTELPEFVNADYKFTAKLLEQKRHAETASAILEEAEVEAFLKSTSASAGLLVMGSNLQTHKQTRTSLSCFVIECCRRCHNNKGFWVIKHFAGLRAVEQAEEDHTQYSGVAGLLRSMCHQLIAIARSTLLLDVVDTWSADSIRAVYEGDISMLCRLFRHLLLEVGTVARKGNNRHTVLVIVDSIHVLEHDEHRADFYQVVDFFRDLCDETMFGDLGGTLKFQYMFLHNGISRLILKSYPRERIIIHETWESK